MKEKIMNEDELRSQQLSLLIGTIIGQIYEILNHMNDRQSYIYKALFDVHQMAGLQIHELYYKNLNKGKKR